MPTNEYPALLRLMDAPAAEQLPVLAAMGLPATSLLILMSACDGRCFFCARETVLSPPPELITPWPRVRAWLEAARPVPATRLCLGGTRPPAELAAIAADWGVVYRKADAGGSALGYAVDHSTDAYLVGPDGRFVRALPHGSSAEAVAAALRGALAAAPASEAEGPGAARAGGLPGAGPG